MCVWGGTLWGGGAGGVICQTCLDDDIYGSICNEDDGSRGLEGGVKMKPLLKMPDGPQQL